MKMKLLTAVFAVIIIAMAFNTQQQNNLAEVNQIQGLYVFTDSKPVQEYEYLGTVKSPGIVMSVKHEAIMDILLKKAKKEFRDSEAIILSNDYFQADVIKFKE